MTKEYARALRGWFWVVLMAAFPASALAAAKPHVIAFGKWTSVQRPDAEGKLATVKVRPLLVDARVKEFTLGPPHEITDRLFVVRRAFRVNDSLPQETATAPRWQWERGGWLLVDRLSGKVSAVNLPEFDAEHSSVSWYRDYAAYCGVSDDGKRAYAVVAQVSRRKPMLKQVIEGKRKTDLAQASESAESDCAVPTWQREPVRVTFELPGVNKTTFIVHGHMVDLVGEEEETDEAAK